MNNSRVNENTVSSNSELKHLFLADSLQLSYLIINSLQLSGCLLNQHNYLVVQYNEQFRLLKLMFSCDSANFLHAIFISMNFLQLSGCLLKYFGPTQLFGYPV